MKEDKAIIPISKDFVSDVRRIIENGRQQAFSATSAIALATYWNIGRRIVEEEQKGHIRAEYGSRLIAGLAEDLRAEYGASYSKRNLEHFRKFYLVFNDLQIVNELVHNLTWTHIRRLLSVTNSDARLWYMAQASKDMWSTTTLDRNISSHYYERRLAEQRKHPNETLPDAVAPYNDSDPLEYIKNPTVAEFMGFQRNSKYSESELEQALIDNLEKFILELGRGFAFVERQQHITTEMDDFYIDLVFYNFRMKRFVIFELKTHRMNHGDVGQLDMYVRMYDDLMKGPDDNPTIGVLLCTDTDSTIAKYSVLNDSNQLFAAKYMTYMPTEEELRHEIERQKQFFLDHHKND
ncbi:MAG: DUF1016 domain-containing protein [Bacteroidales bacterium]|nr:DUF1016 domain-containing protein [Bacteroidales bacterium]